MRNKLIFIVFIFFIFFTTALYAQEEEQLADEQTTAEDIFPVEYEISEETPEIEEEIDIEEVLTGERQRIEMEIRTSTLSELAHWCQTLGLSQSGTREELSRRLREHFLLRSPEAQNQNNRRIITIESAQTTEYFTITEVNEDYARLRGDVRISLKDGDTTHRISANEILFNRTRNILTARGQVIYQKIESDKTETFRGENITVNIDNWASTFLDGNTRHELGSDGSSYLFSGEVISRNNEDVTILSNARVTSGTSEEALWSITASRIWLLPGSDFAISNAVLKVGEIPVLYIPFFYYPADELVFHPVFGFRSREGGFIQTTTYILGRPKADPDEKSSIAKILGNADDTERELHGIFLRSTGRMAVNQNEVSLRAIADYYVNLGYYFGTDLSVPRAGIINQTELSLGLGLSRTVTQTGSIFTPYAPNYDGTFDWNHSNFLSMHVPFRYRIRFNSSMTGRYGHLLLNFLYFSDPFVERDFLNRSENMDFFNIVQQGRFDDSLLTQPMPQWHLSGNLNPSVTALRPFISNVSISSISTTLAFRTIRDNSVFTSRPDAPERLFFAPDKFTVYSISASVSGTPLSTGRAQGQTRTQDTENNERDEPLRNIGIPISPWTNNDNEQETANESQNILGSNILTPPVLTQNFSAGRDGNLRFNINYNISPTSTTELQYMSTHWNTYNDVDWNDIQSVLTIFGGSSNVNFRMDHSTGLFNSAVTLSGNATWRDLTYQNEDAYANETAMENARRQQFGQTNYTTSYTFNNTVRPFFSNPIFSNTNFAYNFRGTLVRSKRFTGGDGPELTPQWGSWQKENVSEEIYGLNAHQIAANIAANIFNRNQTISLSASLPPLDGLISVNAAFRFWISETSVNFRMEKPETSEEWLFRPINITETLRFENIGSLTYFMSINPDENNEISTIRANLALWNFRADFSAAKATRFVFLPPSPQGPSGWVQQGEPVLSPRDLILTYNRTFPEVELINNRLSSAFRVSSSLNFDLQRHTNSNFQLTMGVGINIPGLLRIELASTTQNAVIWRYFKGMPGMDNLTWMYQEGPQNNVFLDLLDSFNFFDESKRRRTGFKMHSFNFSTIHYLGDWTAELKVDIYPHPSNQILPPKYEITADISFLVQWTPIPEIQSNINFQGRHNRWEIQ
jgi:hypothetical protein